MAKITTITNPLTGQPAQVDQLDHTAQEIDDGIGFESTDYPGCYYRTVDGVTEWVNPPMIPGTEYRTTERWNGAPVYAQIFDCSPLPNATTKVFPVEEGKNYADNVVVVVDYGGMSTYYGQSLQNRDFVSLNVTQSKISITTEVDRSAGNAYVWVKYVKSPS